jgi:hypothetical protein
MSKDLTKRASPTKPESQQPADAASRLKQELMSDALGRMFGETEEKLGVAGPPRAIIALANYYANSGRDRAEAVQRQLFAAAAGSGLELKFAFYDVEDSNTLVRPCKITKRWITGPDDMTAVIGRTRCDCGGCFVYIRSVLSQAAKEAEDRPLRAVIIVADAFHDNQNNLDEAAICANQLRRAGTRVFLIQLGADPDTARRLQYLARVSDGAYFRFDPRTQEQQFAEMFEAVSVFTAGGEEAVRAKGGQAATLLLEDLKQMPMSPVETRERAVEHGARD